MAFPPLGVGLIVASVVLPILAGFTILLRVSARARSQKKLDASDYFLFFAMVSAREISLQADTNGSSQFIAMCNSVSCIAGAVIDGMGKSLNVLNLEEQTGFMKVPDEHKVHE